jgi:hypothetical protein
VRLTTVDNGDIHVPLVVNNGAGNVIVAAGSNLDAGDGTGGQVKPMDGNTITNNDNGKLLVYTGNANDTGVLKHLTRAFDTLYLAGSKNNVAFDKAFGATLPNDAKAQVLFRQATVPTVTGSLATAEYSRDYNAQTVTQSGDLAGIKTALKTVNTGDFTNTVGNNNTFGVSIADVIDALALDSASNSIKNVKRDSSNSVAGQQLVFDKTGLSSLPGFSLAPDSAAPTLKIQPLAARVNANATTVTTNGAVQTQTATLEGFLPADAAGLNVSGLRSESTPGTYNSNVVVTASDPDLLDNYNITVTNAAFTIVSDTIPPGPVVPPTPPSPNNNTVVVAGGSNSFQLAGAEGTCSADTLDQCECESASSATGEVMEGIQICYEPNKAR